MVYSLSCERIDETVEVNRATARVIIRQDRTALETEPSTAEATHHLVALSVLSSLLLEILLRDWTLTLRTLLRSCFLHPLSKAFFCLLGFRKTGRTPSSPLGMLLACELGVIRLRATFQAGHFAAQGTFQSWLLSLLQTYAHWAIWCRTRA